MSSWKNARTKAERERKKKACKRSLRHAKMVCGDAIRNGGINARSGWKSCYRAIDSVGKKC